MKWIFALLLLISASAIGQTEDSLKYIHYKFQYGSRMPRFWADSALHMPYGDTALFAKPQKPGHLMMHTDKIVYRWDGLAWQPMGSSGSATLSNVGSGYRLVKTADGQVKTVFVGYGVIADSSTNTNGITLKADTSSTNHVVTQSDLNDAIAGGGSGISGLTSGRVVIATSSTTVGDDAGFTYNATTNKLTADSADLIQSRADSFFVRNQAQYVKPDTANILGNSHFVGQGATVTDSAVAYRESAGLDVIPVSLAVSGTGAVSTANRFLINKNPGNTTMALAMVGFNDPRRNGLPRNTLNKIINAHKAIFANQYLKSYTNAGTGGTGVTRSGSWVNSWDASAEGGKTSVGAYTSTTNDSITYVFPAADSTLVAAFAGGDGSGSSYTGTDIDVRFDGLPITITINTNNQTDGVADGSGLNNKRCAMAFIFTGLSNTVHTVTFIKKSTGGGGFMIVDYFGHLVPRSQAQLMLWHHIPKMNATGYATSPANATDATTDTVNAKIDSLKLTYPISLYPTYVVPTNTVYNVATDIDPDGIHMANAGHRKIADLALNVTLNNVVPAPGVDGAIYYDNEYKGVVNGLKETFLMRGAADSRYIRNRSSLTQTADFKISGTGTADRYVTAGSIFSGSITNADRQTSGIAGGIASGGPVLSLRNNSGATNARTWDWFVGSDAMEQRVLSDNLADAPYIIRVKVSPTPLIDSIKMPKLDIIGNLNVGGTATVADDAYNATTWNGNLEVPTKNAVRDKIESLSGGSITSINGQTGASQTISGAAGVSVGSSSDVTTIGLNTTLDVQVADANNTGTSATDLYSKTIAANQLTLNGHSIHFEAAGVNNDATATVNLEALFAGNGIAGTGAVTITGTGVWSMRGTIIRATSTTARVYTVVTIDNCTQKVFSTTANLTGLDWTATNILKIQATAGGGGGGSNDITAQMWKVVFQP